MKKIKIACILLISMPLFSAKCKHHDDRLKKGVVSVEKDSSRFPGDMVLIYDGGSGRKPWNKDQIRPYLYRVEDGRVQWQFDGFLFLEIMTSDNGVHYSFVVNNTHNKAAGKKQWLEILDQTFTAGNGPDAIEELLDSLDKKGIVPPYKRKIVFSIPNPVRGVTDWGSLKGKTLDFNDVADRVDAAEWYVNQVLKRWKKKRFKHLKLAGFYWVRESITNPDAEKVVQEMSHYIHDKDFNFYWIPYNRARHAGDWKQLGFDIAYQQPNYFFKLSSPYSVLTGALDFAREHKMDMEMEFDGRLIKQKAYRDKYYDYLHEFQKEGVWDHKHVAYYEGGGAWLQMSKSKDPVVKEAYDALGDILNKRKDKNIYSK